MQGVPRLAPLARDDTSDDVYDIAEFRERFTNPFVAAERGYIDAVIEPADTRTRVITALRALENKKDTNPRKKHGNIPL